ncbi:CDP-alcohol phosphatidyltransferase [bacterium]|nr:CDP-alcohol phosphatidyltransferase [Chloroflexi bacterium CFX6]RIL08991.1 MAG: CDP-alcohol phosphatidyltransferase [bacterium]
MATGNPTTTRFSRLRFVVVNAMTSLNLVLGVLAIILASTDQLALAAWCLLGGAVFDGCDGTLARRWNVSSAFGAQLDSLADMTSFIVGGGALVYFWTYPPETDRPVLGLVAVCSCYVLAGAVRLARFNAAPANPGYFQGVPSTIVAVIVALNALLHPAMSGSGVVGLVLVLSVLMVSVFPYPKLSAMAPHVPRWGVPLFAAIAIVNLSWTVWVATSLYLFSGPWISARRRYGARAG